MLRHFSKRMLFIAILGLTLIVAACGTGDNGDTEDTGGNGDGGNGEASGLDLPNVGDGESIELAYVEWDTEVASTHVIGLVLEEMGYDVTVTPLDNAVMWQSVATGETDAMVAAWLPGTHGDLHAEHEDQLVDLGTNFEGAKIGLVVPSYMDIDSIEDLPEVADELNQSITAIEAGAGVVQASERAVDEYGLDGWQVQTSSSGAMATALGEAINNEEPIVVTGWSPHWKFAEYDLKYLEDPQGVFGDAEEIVTFTRQGLEDDLPEAVQVLEQFHWNEDQFNSVMLDIYQGTDPEDAARTFVDENTDLVQEWVDGVE